MVLIYMQDLPNLDDFDKKDHFQNIDVTYSNGNIIKSYGNLGINEVSFFELPNHLIEAVVAIEDRRFFDHIGIDFVSIIRALYINHKKGYIAQGASTITQQLAKMLFLDSQKTFKRKIQEVLLSFQLERKFNKEQILELYLNRAYFGSGNYGIKNAAKNYFNKDISEINLNESAILAGLLKAPSKLSPKNNPKLAEERANLVIKNMIQNDYLNQEDILELGKQPNYHIDSMQRFYLADIAYRNYKNFLPTSFKQDKALKIKTTLDENIQKRLQNVAQNFLVKYNQKLANSQIAVLVMNHQGEVKAVIGGKNYQDSQFNRAFDAKRQAGSLLKTFIYLAAFENGYQDKDTAIDSEIQFSDWLPSNYNNIYYGEVDLKTAFAKSLNSVAVQLAQKVTINKVVGLLKNFNIKTPKKNDLTIALGSPSVTLFEITGAYAIIANGGNYIIPSYIDSIIQDQDNIIYQRYGSQIGKVISNQSWYMIDNLLAEVVKSGTGRKARSKIIVKGKTGTSQKFRDAWFVGYSNNYVIGIWLGRDDYKSTNEISGGSLPAILFSQIIDKIDSDV